MAVFQESLFTKWAASQIWPMSHSLPTSGLNTQIRGRECQIGLKTTIQLYAVYESLTSNTKTANLSMPATFFEMHQKIR